MLRLLGRSLCFLALLSATTSAQLAQSFIGDFPAIAGNQEYLLSGNAIWEENGYVTVTPGVGSQNGGFFTNAIGSGSYGQLQISFDLRLSESGAGGADGYGFALLPTDVYGSTVSGQNPAFSEEVNLSGVFGLGFDTYDNGDTDRTPIDEVMPDPATGDRTNESGVSLHWNGALLGTIWGPSQVPPFNLEPVEGMSANYNMNLFIVPNGAGDSAVTLTMTNLDSGDTLVPFAALEIPGMDIQDYRIGFRGRTGGAWNKQEVGNVTIIEDGNDPISLTLLQPGAPPPLATLIGGSPFFGIDEVGVEGSSRVTTGRLAGGAGPRLKADDAAAGGEIDGYLSLTQSIGGEQNFITFATSDNGTRLGFGGRTGGAADDYQIDNVVQTSTSSRITTDFDFRAILGSGADGFSMILVNSEDYPDADVPIIGTANVDGWNVAEEPLISGGLGIGFKTFQSEQVRLRYNGQNLGDVDAPTVKIVNGEWEHATVIAEACESGANTGLCVTVSMDGFDADGNPASATVFDNVFVLNATLGGLVVGGPTLVPGDANGDRKVDAADLNVVGLNWQKEVANGIPDGDFDESGFVNAGDLNILGRNWQFGVAAPAAVPEPAGITLSLFALFGLLSLRRYRR